MSDPIDQEEATEVALSILDDLRPNRYARVAPLGWFTDDGFGIISNEAKFTFGFGVMSGLRPDPMLLGSIDVFNKRANLGHAWLAEGGNGDNWILMWGIKLMLDFVDRDSFGRTLGNSLYAYPQLFEMAYQLKGAVGDRFWPTRTLEHAHGVILLTQLS